MAVIKKGTAVSWFVAKERELDSCPGQLLGTRDCLTPCVSRREQGWPLKSMTMRFVMGETNEEEAWVLLRVSSKLLSDLLLQSTFHGNTQV